MELGWDYNTMNKVWIYTLNWNGEDKLKKLYPSLINSLDHVNYEYLIKDNDSKDNSIQYLNSFNNNKLKCIKYKNNLQNFSEGMNFLFHESSPADEDYILLLNNDVIFNDKTSIRNMINIMEKDPDIGVVGARLLFTGTDKLQHAGVVFHNQVQMPMHFRAGQASDKLAEANREFQAVTGAVLLTKAKYYKEICKTNPSGINGMSEDYRWAFDDMSLCLAIKYNMNKKIIYCGQTNISHEESASLKKNPVNKLFMPHNSNLLKNTWSKRYVLDWDIYTNDPKYGLYER